jgi:RNA polymerase sigma-70 factor, ECF subfamily
MVRLSSAHTTDDAGDEPLSSRTVERDEPPPASLKEMVESHLDFVWRSLRRFGVPSADVDDATQRVFLIANDKLDRIRTGSERSFLIGVAARVASHARRSYHRREAAELGFSTAPPPEGNPNPEELTQRREDRDLLDRVLDAMPAELRAVFVLFELEELSIDEMAALLTLPRGTVASRLRRAREVFHVQAKLLSSAGTGTGVDHE